MKRKMSAYGEHEAQGGYILDDYNFSRNRSKAITIRRWKRNLKKKARQKIRLEIEKIVKQGVEE